MFRFIGFVVAAVLGIISGNKIGDAINSGLVGFVGGLICFVVFWVICAYIGGLLDQVVDAISDRNGRRQLFGKSKYVNLR